MTSYARVLDDEIVSTGPPPDLLEPGDITAEDRWWDLRKHDLDLQIWESEVIEPHGWLPVVSAERPPDTDETTSDYSLELVDGVPTEVWTERPWTPGELAQKDKAVVHTELVAEQTDAVDDLIAAVGVLNALQGADVDPAIQVLAGAVLTIARAVNREARLTTGQTDDNYTGITVWIEPKESA